MHIPILFFIKFENSLFILCWNEKEYVELILLPIIHLYYLFARFKPRKYFKYFQVRYRQR